MGRSPIALLAAAYLSAALGTCSTASAETWSRVAIPGGIHFHTMTLDPLRDRAIVFGGVMGVNTNAAYVMPLDGDPIWGQLDATGAPPTPRNLHSAVYDPVRDRLLVFGGNTTSNGAIADLWALNLGGTPSWSQLPSAGTPPPARWGHSAIYDPVRDRMLVMGGHTGSIRLNDVWELSLAGTPTWTQLTPAGGPPTTRWGHAAIYDPVGDRMVIHGGVNLATPLGDTWALSFTGDGAWTNLTPSNPPPARWVHAVAYDAATQRLLIFGGYNGTSNFADTWALDLSGTPAWSQLSPGGTLPTARLGTPAVFDPGRRKLLVFGGNTPGGDVNDLWSLAVDGSLQWEQRLPVSVRPPFRYMHGAAYDPLRKRMIIMGGFRSGGFFFNDVWSLSLEGGSTWTPWNPAGPLPGVRHSHTVTYDEVHDRLIVIGGVRQNSTTRYNDVWALSLGANPAWTQLTPSGTGPSELYAHTAIYDAAGDRIICFGGYAPGAVTNDVWVLSLDGNGSWSHWTPAGTPPAGRAEHSAVLDPVRHRMIVSGGLYVSPPNGEFTLSDVWALSLDGTPTWTQLMGNMGFNHLRGSSVYLPGTDQLLLLSGSFTAVAPLRADVTSLSGAHPFSTVFTGMLAPTTRIDPTAIHDPTTGRTLLYGGANLTATLEEDVWALQSEPNLGVGPGGPALSVALAQPYPAPARENVTIGFTLSSPVPVTLQVYDVAGRWVRTLVDGVRAAGEQRVRWDLRTASGARARPGLYLYELRTDRTRLARKVLVVH